MRLAIDFDGTLMSLTDISEGKTMGNPIPGAKEAMEQLRRNGHTLIIHSVRGDKPGHVADWLNYYKIPYDEITRTKPNDIAFFIDDHGLRFEGDWARTIAELHMHHSLYQAKKNL